MSQTLIGLTIVSIGTSLPELVTSIVAAKKNEVDMALGNAVGSNIFNILMVLGIASAISPITLIRENIIDLCVLIVFTVCVWIFAATKKRIGKSGRVLYDRTLCGVCDLYCDQIIIKTIIESQRGEHVIIFKGIFHGIYRGNG